MVKNRMENLHYENNQMAMIYLLMILKYKLIGPKFQLLIEELRFLFKIEWIFLIAGHSLVMIMLKMLLYKQCFIASIVYNEYIK